MTPRFNRDEIWNHVAETLDDPRAALPVNHRFERALVDAICDAAEHHIAESETRAIAFAIAALDEMNQRICALEARIAELEARKG